MRLFLSSYRLGGAPHLLTRLAGTGGRAVVVANAADAWPAQARAWAVRSEVDTLGALGYSCAELDLRRHVGDPAGVRAALAGAALVWARGGNTFVLRAQLARSGADTVLRGLLAEDALAYGGYSAGACVACPSLRGLEALDDPAEVAQACGGAAPRWDGLGLVPYQVVPHHRSPGHEHPERVEALLAWHLREGTPVRALTDTEVVIVQD